MMAGRPQKAAWPAVFFTAAGPQERQNDPAAGRTEGYMEREAVSILWDVEDVTPTITAPFVRGLLNFARGRGRLALIRVFGDWSKPANAAIAEELTDETFELIHVPASRRERGREVLGAQMVDLLNAHPHIRTFILISGSASFIPTLQVVRTGDVRTVAVCDARDASEALLLTADEFRDFRDLTEVPAEEQPGQAAEPLVTEEEALELLEEAITSMEERRVRPSIEAVRARLELMNHGFSPQKLGYASWKEFVAAAEQRGVVRTLFREQDLILTAQRRRAGGEQGGSYLPEIFRSFLGALAEALGSTKTSYGNMAKLPAVAQKLDDRGIDPRRHGYSQLKRLADAAAKRGLVTITVKDSGYLLALTQKGRQHSEKERTP
jgi:hypothetical protein